MRRSIFALAMVAALCIAVPATAYAASWHVSVAGSDTTGTGSAGAPYATVQHAVDQAAGGDDVYVGPGTFVGNVTMKDGVSLHGSGASVTTLTAAGSDSVVTASSVGSATIIEGFTITGGNGPEGGGISNNSGSPTIKNNTITGNTVFMQGGGIFNYSGSPTISNNTITGNTSTGDGGGIFNYSGSPTISNNTITGNTSSMGDGGGIFNYNGSPAIRNNTIVGNSARMEGGGIFNYSGSPTITNSILWGNGDDLYTCAATYSDVSDGEGGLGNISVPPSFVSTATGDYRLAIGSPCIDVATSTAAPATDEDGIARPQGAGFDMGAYEFPRAQDDSAVSYSKTVWISVLGNDASAVGRVAGFTQPAHGVVATGVANPDSIGYTPNSGFLGSDAFTYTAANGSTATVTVRVLPSSADPNARATRLRLTGAPSVKAKKTYKVVGSISPAAAGGSVRVALYRLLRRKWRSAGSATMRVSGGRCSYSFKPKYKGSWKAVATYGGQATPTATFLGSSATKMFKVK